MNRYKIHEPRKPIDWPEAGQIWRERTYASRLVRIKQADQYMVFYDFLDVKGWQLNDKRPAWFMEHFEIYHEQI